MAPKRPYAKRSTQFDKPVEFQTVRSVSFFTDGEKNFQAALTFMDNEPLVGLQRLWFDSRANEWKFTRKSVFMSVPAWKAFIGKVEEINGIFEPLFDQPPPPSAKELKASRPAPPEIGPSSSSTKGK